MGFDAWLTLVVVAAVVYAVARELVPLALGMLSGIAILLVAGVLEVEEAFAGFSNPAPLSVAALFVLAKAVEKSGALEHLISRLLGQGDRVGGTYTTLARATVPTAVASGFMNSTPIVAMLAPAVAGWARRVRRPASTFLMPISFAAILGGLLTLIGTSTNLVVSGAMRAAGQPEMGLFEIGRVGLPVAVVGMAVLIMSAPKLLPERRSPGEGLKQAAREFTVEMTVGPALAGKDVAAAGLRNLEGVFLVEIERGQQLIAPVAPDRILHDGDRLTFAGNIDRVLDLQRMPGLVPTKERLSLTDDHGRRFYECVVSSNSPLVGTTLKEIGFRSRYGAAVFAIHRAGERLSGKLGEVQIGPGDVLLVIGDGGWRSRWGDHRDFLMVAPLAGGPPLNKGKARIVGLVLAALLGVVGFGVLDVLPAAMVAGLILIGTKVLTRSEARDAVDIEIIVAIAASFGLGEAMSLSGLAETVGGGILTVSENFGDLAVLGGVLLATVLLTEMVTNNAAAVLMFPIAMATAMDAGLDPRPFAFAVAVGASLSFMTPIGYQTNTIVYGLGGYRFAEFLRLGSLLTPVVMITALAVIPLAWPLRP